ncbi:MAG: Fic family protein, partial [Deltaproteobacteria bacterium]|nr:Fic family protein [Deltaproteobacteria bacterium]
MRVFDYSYLEHGMFPAAFLNTVGGIYERKERMNRIGTSRENLSPGRDDAVFVSSVNGAALFEETVFETPDSADARRPERDALWEARRADYGEALARVLEDHDAISVNEENVLKLHGIMTSRSGAKGGRYKEVDGPVRELGLRGNRVIRFQPVSAEETKEYAEALFKAFANAEKNPEINKLLLIPCFVLDFLCVRPFEEGNERMATLISVLLMLRNGFDVWRRVSFEAALC